MTEEVEYIWKPCDQYPVGIAIAGRFTDETEYAYPKDYMVVAHAIGSVFQGKTHWEVTVGMYQRETHPALSAFLSYTSHTPTFFPDQTDVLPMLQRAFEIARRWQENPETIQQDCLNEPG